MKTKTYLVTVVFADRKIEQKRDAVCFDRAADDFIEFLKAANFINDNNVPVMVVVKPILTKAA